MFPVSSAYQEPDRGFKYAHYLLSKFVKLIGSLLGASKLGPIGGLAY